MKITTMTHGRFLDHRNTASGDFIHRITALERKKKLKFLPVCKFKAPTRLAHIKIFSLAQSTGDLNTVLAAT